MAASQVSVVNLALTKLGQDRAINIADDVESVRVMRSLWDLAVDCVLADHPWRFAIKRTTLPALADEPEGSDWARQFQLPEECLRLVQVQEDWAFYTSDMPGFTLEGSVILTNEEAPLFVRYVQRISNVGLWPPMFARAVAMRLAADASEKLTGNNTKGEKAEMEYQATVARAKKINAIELPPLREPTTSWLAARGD